MCKQLSHLPLWRISTSPVSALYNKRRIPGTNNVLPLYSQNITLIREGNHVSWWRCSALSTEITSYSLLKGQEPQSHTGIHKDTCHQFREIGTRCCVPNTHVIRQSLWSDAGRYVYKMGEFIIATRTTPSGRLAIQSELQTSAILIPLYTVTKIYRCAS